jgi:hypothetical protein
MEAFTEAVGFTNHGLQRCMEESLEPNKILEGLLLPHPRHLAEKNTMEHVVNINNLKWGVIIGKNEWKRDSTDAEYSVVTIYKKQLNGDPLNGRLERMKRDEERRKVLAEENKLASLNGNVPTTLQEKMRALREEATTKAEDLRRRADELCEQATGLRAEADELAGL